MEHLCLMSQLSHTLSLQFVHSRPIFPQSSQIPSQTKQDHGNSCPILIIYENVCFSSPLSPPCRNLAAEKSEMRKIRNAACSSSIKSILKMIIVPIQKSNYFGQKLVWKLFLLKCSETTWLCKIISNSMHLIWYSHNWLNHIIDFWLNTYTIWIYSTKLKWILLQNYNIQIVLDCGYILTIKVLNMTSLNIREAFHVLYGIKISCFNVNCGI